MPVLNAYEGPVYMRLFRKQLPTVFAEDYKFDLFKADTLKEGKDLTIFVSGFLTKDVLDASEQLAAEGIDAEIVNVHALAQERIPVCAVGVEDRFGEVGKLPYLREAMGLTVENIVAGAKKALALK